MGDSQGYYQNSYNPQQQYPPYSQQQYPPYPSQQQQPYYPQQGNPYGGQQLNTYSSGSSTSSWLDESSMRIDRTDDETVYYVLKSFLLGGGLVLSLLILLLSACCRRGHFRGIRWYAVNLMLVNLIHIANMVLSDNTYGIHKLLTDQLRSDEQTGYYYPYQVFNAYKYFIKNYDGYKECIKRWVMCVYCFTTTFLALETVHRYRTNSKGLPNLAWFVLILFADLAPMAIFITMIQGFSTTRVVPNPYLSYHFIVLVMVTLALIVFLLLSTCLCCCGGAGGKTTRSFAGPALAGVVFYFAITVIIQYPYGYIVSYDLGREIDERYSSKLQISGYRLQNVFQPMEPYVSTVAYINNWCLIAFAMLTSLAMLLFMPGYRMCCRARDAGSTNSVGDSGEHA